MIRESLQNRVLPNNEKVLSALVEQLRSPVGVIPFLGAGVSASLGYRQWGAFLSSVAAEQLAESERRTVEAAISEQNFLKAAGMLSQRLGPHEFQQAIADEFSDKRLQQVDLRKGLLSYLPLISGGPVITTNFDRVVEHTFEAADRRFEACIYGSNPNEVVPAIQQNRLVLWKLHGDRGDDRTRVFSEKEYGKHYRDLPRIMAVAFLNRPALFLGCSLDKDRTLDVLESLSRRHPGTRHFAFLQIPESDDDFERRLKELRAMSVRPYWYPIGEHHEIERALSRVVHAASSVLLPNVTAEPAHRVEKAGPELAALFLDREMDELSLADRTAQGETQPPFDAPPYAPVADSIIRGQTAFFLGAGACLGRLPLGREFYGELITRLNPRRGDASETSAYGSMEPARIAQHFADKYGRDALYSEVDRQLGQAAAEPTAIHWFLAALEQRIRAMNLRPSQQWIITTNYDDWMTLAMRYAGLRYHLFTYRVSKPHAGKFIYQAPDGEVRVIDRPANFRRISAEDPVLVYLHGGLHRSIDLPTSYAFTHRDFVELAGRIPEALPHVVFEKITERSLLFLGSGLGDDTIESLVRGIRARSSARRSHAVCWWVGPEKKLYWGELGVDIFNIPLQVFMPELNKEFASRTPEAPRGPRG